MSEKLTLFDRFGGARKMAAALNEPVSTVQSWKTAGRIPAGKQPDVLAKARRLQLGVSAEDIIFPLGADDEADDGCGSATKSPNSFAGNICDEKRPDNSAENIDGPRRSDSHGPFSVSPSTCSTTRGPNSCSTSQVCSTGKADAA